MSDTLSSFSNYGSWVKVAAPGSDIASTYTGSGYVSMSGTSMAAPLVAGQAALIRSQNPALSNTLVEELIVGSTDPYTPLSGRTIGGGRVNVYRALQAATPATSEPAPTVETLAPSAPTNLSGQAISKSQINLSWTDTAGNEDGFTVERSADGVNFTVVATLGVNSVKYSDLGLSTFTFYSYRVRAFNTTGTSASSNTVKVRTARK
jgi:subtilisin family serine protease